jgi:hypothetical protein
MAKRKCRTTRSGGVPRNAGKSRLAHQRPSNGALGPEDDGEDEDEGSMVGMAEGVGEGDEILEDEGGDADYVPDGMSLAHSTEKGKERVGGRNGRKKKQSKGKKATEKAVKQWVDTGAAPPLSLTAGQLIGYMAVIAYSKYHSSLQSLVNQTISAFDSSKVSPTSDQHPPTISSKTRHLPTPLQALVSRIQLLESAQRCINLDRMITLMHIAMHVDV